jgi:outer membrane protein
MSLSDRLVCTFVPVLLAGCAANPLELAPARPDQSWSPATDAKGEIIAGRPAAAAPADASWVLPPNAAAAVVPPPPPGDAGRPSTLPELIDLAQSSHPDTRIAWEDARRAAAAAGIARAAYLPQVTASILGGQTTAHARGSTIGVDNDQNSTSTGAFTSLSVLWLLFDFGQREAVLEVAQQGSVVANIGFTAAHQRVIHEVCLAYYALASAQAHVASAAEALKNAQDIQAAAEDRLQHGVGTLLDVMQARQATAQARLAQVRAGGGAQDAQQALVTAVGVSPLSRMQVAELPQRPLAADTARSVERIVAEALARRPDVLAAYSQEKAAAAGVRAAEAEFRPKIFLSGSAAYGGGHLNVTTVPSIGQTPGAFNLSGTRWSNTVLLGLSVPLYDGALRSSRLQQARAEAGRAAAAAEGVRNQAVRQIVAAQNAVETSLSAHQASNALLAAVRTSYDASLDAYRRGVGTVTALTSAATQLLEASDATTDAYSSALAAAATLAFASGSLGGAPR